MGKTWITRTWQVSSGSRPASLGHVVCTVNEKLRIRRFAFLPMQGEFLRAHRSLGSDPLALIPSPLSLESFGERQVSSKGAEVRRF
jgi:hypothetical protein